MRSASTVVFRPRRASLVIYPLAGVLLVGLGIALVTLPWHGRTGWGIGSRVALALTGLAVLWFLHRLAAVRVVADEAGATVVNILHRRRLDWAEIVGVRLLRDDAWMMLDLSDGGTMAAMGVQTADGRRAQEQAQRFARMVAEHTRTPRDD